MFPLADARGRVIGFQARKLRDDDPLKGKYVNSPESELFKKSNVLYGLHLARPAIAKQDRAVVVEGNTDVIALRQAGFEPVVASMGTALTEQHLRELGRLTKRLYLCFDADAAGEEATLRGMERAHGQGFDIRVVVLPPGQDPADAPDGLRAAARPGRELPPLPRPPRARARRRPAGGIRPRAGDPRPRPRTRPSARRRCGSSPTGSTCRARRSRGSRRPEALRLRSGPSGASRRSCSTPASGSSARPSRRSSRTRAARGARRPRRGALRPRGAPADAGSLVAGAPPDADLVGLLAELDATAASEGITRRTGTEMLLRLRERKLRRDLQGETDLARATELQAHLAKVRQALTELA